jgi:hypothetical protein
LELSTPHIAAVFFLLVLLVIVNSSCFGLIETKHFLIGSFK